MLTKMAEKETILKNKKLKVEKLKVAISKYQKHLEKALEEGIENLAEIFKTQIKHLNREIDLLEEN